MSQLAIVMTTLALFLALVSFVTAIMLLLQQKKLQAQLHILHEQKKTLEAKQAELSKSSLWLFERIMKTEKKLATLEQQQGQENSQPVAAASAVSEPLDVSYGQATELIDQGIDHNELAERLGISESEAKLMVMMHQSVIDQ